MTDAAVSADSPLGFVHRPGLVWGYDFADGRAEPIEDSDLVGRPRPLGGLRWLHFNLSDSRTERWVAGASPLGASPVPERIRELFLSADDHQRHLVADGVLGAVLHDVRQDFIESDTSIGALRLAVAPGLIVTARHHPIRCADVVRDRLRHGAAPADEAAGLELLFSAMSEVHRTVVAELDDRVQDMEDDLVRDRPPADAKTFLGARSLIVRLHRALSGMRAVLHRIELDVATPSALEGPVSRFESRVTSMASELVTIQGQLRLVREELDLQATQRTNQNLYVLSIMSALLLPATLVTGFFGMNTGGFPWGPEAHHGTAYAALVAAGSSLTVYLGLRVFGFLKR